MFFEKEDKQEFQLKFVFKMAQLVQFPCLLLYVQKAMKQYKYRCPDFQI